MPRSKDWQPEHGTDQGYSWHVRSHTLAEAAECGCRQAHAKLRAERKAELAGYGPVRIKPFPHGTPAGYERHRREGTVAQAEACGCRLAKNQYQAMRKREQRKRLPQQRVPYVRGTPNALTGGHWETYKMIKRWVPDA